jgi:hypothetical protein
MLSTIILGSMAQRYKSFSQEDAASNLSKDIAPVEVSALQQWLPGLGDSCWAEGDCHVLL